jgi:hypothetical protein
MSTMISQSMLPEFDQEMSNLRKTLERVPEGKPDFRPHQKSMTLSQLAGHLAERSGVSAVPDDDARRNACEVRLGFEAGTRGPCGHD